jgi:3',5'-cyclic AMP phosphodiesterase CpdA
MRDELAIVLRLVADGRLSPEDAAPLIDALSRSAGEGIGSGLGQRHPDWGSPPPPAPPPSVNDPRQLRIRVSERGRQVVNLRIPLTFADTALRMVPGLSDEQGNRIRAAIAGKTMGTILDVEDEDGDGVVISME